MRNLLASLAVFAAVLSGVPTTLGAQDAIAPAQSATAPAQIASAQLPPEQAPRRLLFVMESGLVSGYSADQLIILRRSFLTALADQDDAPTPIDFGSKPFPSSLADRNRVAQAAGADCWLLVKVSGLGGSPSISVLSYDLLYKLSTLDFTAHRSEGFSMADVYRERWDDVIPAVLKKYPPLAARSYSRGPPAPVTLTIHGVPGTVITGLSAKPLSMDAKGTLAVDLPSPAPYALRAAASGYVPTRASLYLDGETQLTLDQQRSPWLRLDGAFLDGFFPGVAATFSIPALPFFARLGFTSFRAGIAINQDNVTASLPLSQFTLLLGMYLSPEDNPLRWYVGLGPLLRVSLPAGGSLTVDQLIPFGVQVVGGLELPLAGKLRTFLEYTPGWYYTPLPALFVASFGQNNGTFPYINLPPLGAIDIIELRVGLRYAL
jgi:hypothetical protein